MDIQNRRGLKDAATYSLARSSDSPKKLVLIHLGVSLLVSLLLSVLDFLLEQQIGAAGGLSGLGSRSLMGTVQYLLRLAHIILLPFWQMGYLFLTLKLAREESVNVGTLLEGFRRLGPVLRYHLMLGIMLFGIVLGSSYVAGVIFLFSPFSLPMMEELGPLLSDPTALENEETMELMAQHSLPLLILYAAIVLILLIPFFFRYRMAALALMDTPEIGTLRALRTSRKIMKHHWMDVFKLDLSFWWFYLLEGLVVLVAYGDYLLPMFGISLPLSPNALYFLFLILSMVCQLALYGWRKNEVSVTYAHAYAVLRENAEESSAPQH